MTRRGTLVIVGGETGGRLLGGFERSLGAVLLSPLVSQKLTMLASTENAADLHALRDLIEAGQITPALDRNVTRRPQQFVSRGAADDLHHPTPPRR